MGALASLFPALRPTSLSRRRLHCLLAALWRTLPPSSPPFAASLGATVETGERKPSISEVIQSDQGPGCCPVQFQKPWFDARPKRFGKERSRR
ncbi:hypothetical protein MUK42_37628 [Musa troglodytarum]|uniref:Uncharacterized protein n=1 Tax=Musa troglodytarum TaxID=320322 RepID=A0A9E7JBS6_9LILI|nr:hypothetical protein MUK42_37628 [Musa troglodytarum]